MRRLVACFLLVAIGLLPIAQALSGETEANERPEVSMHCDHMGTPDCQMMESCAVGGHAQCDSGSPAIISGYTSTHTHNTLSTNKQVPGFAILYLDKPLKPPRQSH